MRSHKKLQGSCTCRRGREAGPRSGAALMESTSRSAVSTCSPSCIFNFLVTHSFVRPFVRSSICSFFRLVWSLVDLSYLSL